MPKTFTGGNRGRVVQLQETQHGELLLGHQTALRQVLLEVEIAGAMQGVPMALQKPGDPCRPLPGQ